MTPPIDVAYFDPRHHSHLVTYSLSMQRPDGPIPYQKNNSMFSPAWLEDDEGSFVEDAGLRFVVSSDEYRRALDEGVGENVPLVTRKSHCDCLTIAQHLPPSTDHFTHAEHTFYAYLLCISRPCTIKRPYS